MRLRKENSQRSVAVTSLTVEPPPVHVATCGPPIRDALYGVPPSQATSAKQTHQRATSPYHWYYGTVVGLLLGSALWRIWHWHSNTISLLNHPYANTPTFTLASVLHEFRHATTATATTTRSPPHHHPTGRRVTILHGIFTSDSTSDQAHRMQHRQLFRMWNDSRVCTLRDYVQQRQQQREKVSHHAPPPYTDTPCELIYTFVTGSHPHGPTIQLHNDTRPWLYDDSSVQVDDSHIGGGATIKTPTVISTDWNEPDLLHLNIRDNQHDGKTPTWLAYASTLATAYGFDYITKSDIDTVLSRRDVFWHWAHWHMPPAPYNHLLVQCPPMNTYHFGPFAPRDDFHAIYFNKLYTYCSGEFVVLSTSLAAAVTTEARRWHSADANTKTCPYCNGYEAIDLFDMIYRVHPFKLTWISTQLQFWQTHVTATEWPTVVRREAHALHATDERRVEATEGGPTFLD